MNSVCRTAAGFLGRRTMMFAACLVLVGGVFQTAPAAEEAPLPTALEEYVSEPDESFAWRLQSNDTVPSGKVYEIELVSQTWQGIDWKHFVYIHEPKQLRHPGHVLLFITGGSTGNRPGPDRLAMAMTLAQLTGARVASLHQVPNQPLFEGRVEDDLITDTWLKFLETGDRRWPLLFPMVKSAVRTMDAVQQLGESQGWEPVKGFVVTGASKRGWTTWLSAVADERVIAIAPMVIDVLNFHPQMKYQLETWGKYSEQIDDYTMKGLVKLEGETPREIELRTWMDPYTYRSRLELPKLLIHGTNDRYWVVDATKNYWDDLVGPKNILQIPNAGHNLKGGEDVVFSTLSVFFQKSVRGEELPRIEGTRQSDSDLLSLTVLSDKPPKSARVWFAYSPTKDFRESRWESRELEVQGASALATVPRPATGHTALYAEFLYQEGRLPYSLCTTIWRE